MRSLLMKRMFFTGTTRTHTAGLPLVFANPKRKVKKGDKPNPVKSLKRGDFVSVSSGDILLSLWVFFPQSTLKESAG